MSDDTPITDDERARVEARHAVEALAGVLWQLVKCPRHDRVDCRSCLCRLDPDEAATVALAFARARVPKERAPTLTIRAEECHGWNACRAETLRRLGGEEG